MLLPSNVTYRFSNTFAMEAAGPVMIRGGGIGGGKGGERGCGANGDGGGAGGHGGGDGGGGL